MATTSDHPHINDVEPMGHDDLDCLREVRGVLQRHEKTDRFGVHLLHSHFDVASDEVFVEEVSVKDRTLTKHVFKIDEIELAPDEGLMTTAIDLVDEPTFGQGIMPRSDNCRYVRAPGPDTPHNHVEIYN